MSSLPDESWQRWATAILYYSWFTYQRATSNQNDLKIHQELLSYAYKDASECVIASLLLIIELDNEYSVKSLLNWVEQLWDDRLAEALVGKLNNEHLPPKTMYTLLLHTLQHDAPKAKQYAESLLNQPYENLDGEFAQRTILAARALLKSSKDASWPAVWPSFRMYIELAEDPCGFRCLDPLPSIFIWQIAD